MHSPRPTCGCRRAASRRSWGRCAAPTSSAAHCRRAAGGLVRLSDATYRDRRAGDDGVGRAAASALLKVAEHVGPDAMSSVFPELAAATAVVGRLRDGALPEGFADFDRVVDDEIPDLTLLETAVVVELCLAIARRRGHAP